jgi:hypothetical protein
MTAATSVMNLSTSCVKRSTYAKHLIPNILMLGLNLTLCIFLYKMRRAYIKPPERVEMIIFYVLL